MSAWNMYCSLKKHFDLFQCFWILSCRYFPFFKVNFVSHRVWTRSRGSPSKKSITTSKEQARNAPNVKALLQLALCPLRFVTWLIYNHFSLLLSLWHIVSFFAHQMLTLDPSGNQRQSDRTSGFTSPSHFSSPSFHLCPRVHTPVSPDSMVEYSPNPGDTDGISDTSSISAARPSKAQSTWGFHNKAQQCSHTPSQQYRVSTPLASEEEGSNTHTSTLIPCSGSAAAQGSAANPQMEKTSSLEDPVVLSLWVRLCLFLVERPYHMILQILFKIKHKILFKKKTSKG